MVYSIRNFENAFARDHKIIKTHKMTTFSQDGFFSDVKARTRQD